MKNPLSLIFVIILLSCSGNSKDGQDSMEKSNYEPIIITTKSMEFIAPDSIHSGWNEFIYKNLSGDIHFFVFEKLPPGKTLKNYEDDIVNLFKAALDLMDEGKMEEGMKEFEKIPEWFGQVQNTGGVGLIGPRSTANATFYLEPGRYVLECYVRMPNGRPHALMGMVDEIIVLQDTTYFAEPMTDLEVSISTTEGLVIQDSVQAGVHTFGVSFIDQMKYENMMGHDVNLVRINENSDPLILAAWMNAADPMAFRTPAPNGFEFFGGIQELPAGRTGYFTVDLAPGKYVLIAEIPQAAGRNMMKIFNVYE